MICNLNQNIFVTDFDGTLADDNGIVSQSAILQLKRIENKNVIRVIATGRNLFSLKKSIPEDFPVDYIVFSSGIGVYDWKNKKLLADNYIDANNTKLIYEFLLSNNYDFMVQLPVPDNHFFHHSSSCTPGEDYLSRVRHYESYGIVPDEKCPETASQFVVICPDDVKHFNEISELFRDNKIVRATSPIDRKSLWVEILPKGISKASGIEFIRLLHNVDNRNIIVVGNDYYDIDMLDYALSKNSFVVSNAPEDLKSKFRIVESNNKDGVAKLIEKIY